MIGDFLHAALPWIALGLGVAVVMANFPQGKKEREDDQA